MVIGRNYFIPEKLKEKLNNHSDWIASMGSSGKRLFLEEREYKNLELGSYLLNKAIFEKCILNCIAFGHLPEAEFKDCFFLYGELIDSVCKGAKFTNCTFYDVCFEEADMTSCTFENCVFKNCDFCGAVIKDAVIKNTVFDCSGYAAEIFNPKIENLVITNLEPNSRIIIDLE